MSIKICVTCSEPKSIEEFRRTPLSPDGHAKRCKACCRAARELRIAEPEESAPAAEDPPYGESVVIGPAIGFTVRQRGQDIEIVQDTSAGSANVWLNKLEALELSRQLTRLVDCMVVAAASEAA